MRFHGLGLVCVAALSCSGGVSFAALSAKTVDLPAILAVQIAKAKRSGVRVLIPSRIDAGLPAAHLYASGGANAAGYDIQLAAVRDCRDSNACFVAEFWGGAGRLDLDDRVALSKGITGRYRASSCGASCAPATIEWLEFGSRYMVQFIANKATLVGLADSAIGAGPR
jgi:hypothetical protein